MYAVIGVVKGTGQTVRVERTTAAGALAVWEDYDRNGAKAKVLLDGFMIEPSRLRAQVAEIRATRPFGW